MVSIPVSANNRADVGAIESVESVDLYICSSTEYVTECVPKSICEYLINNDIQIEENSKIEVQCLSQKGEEDISAISLSVTNFIEEGESTFVENIISLTVYDEPVEIATIAGSFANWGTTYPPASEDSRLSILGYAYCYEYNVNGYACVRPVQSLMECTYSEQPLYAYVNYECDGYVCDLNTGELGNREVAYSIECKVNNPVSGKRYIESAPYPTGKAIYTSSALNAGEFITFGYHYLGENKKEWTVWRTYLD